MPASTRRTPLCRYHYDPLDRLIDCTPFELAAIQRYYCKTRLATGREILKVLQNQASTSQPLKIFNITQSAINIRFAL
jgi:hypothetical protein